jgi:hypothetical protein
LLHLSAWLALVMPAPHDNSFEQSKNNKEHV